MSGMEPSDLTELRAQMAALQAQMAALLAERAPQVDAAPCVERLPTESRTRRRGLLRRGLLTGVAALGAGALARVSERVAQATDGQALIVGQDNTATLPTKLARSNPNLQIHAFWAINDNGWGVLAQSSNSSGLYGLGPRSGVFGRCINDPVTVPGDAGVIGVSNSHLGVTGVSDSDTGVYGISGGLGPSLTVAGVTGTSVQRIGVLGTSTGETGVFGVSFGAGPGLGPLAGVAGTSGTNLGVFGTSSSNIGVYGLSTSSAGVYGQGSSQSGTWGHSTSGPGTGGDSTSGFGLYGVSLSNDGVRGNSTGGVGVRGISANSNGVFGQGGGSNAGVAGIGTTGPGLFGQSNSGTAVFATSTSGTGVYGTSSSGLAGWFVGPVQVNGAFTVVGGPKSAAVPHPDGSHRRLYCVESPESWFEDFGHDRLVNGRGRVRLDPDFAAVVQSDNYDVVLTPEGDCNGLYVSNKTPQGFEVQECRGGTSTVAFSYRVVAKRKDVPGPRLERVNVVREAPPLPARAMSAADDAPPIPTPPTPPANAPTPPGTPQPRSGR